MLSLAVLFDHPTRKDQSADATHMGLESIPDLRWKASPFPEETSRIAQLAESHELFFIRGIPLSSKCSVQRCPLCRNLSRSLNSLLKPQWSLDERILSLRQFHRELIGLDPNPPLHHANYDPLSGLNSHLIWELLLLFTIGLGCEFCTSGSISTRLTKFSSHFASRYKRDHESKYGREEAYKSSEKAVHEEWPWWCSYCGIPSSSYVPMSWCFRKVERGVIKIVIARATNSTLYSLCTLCVGYREFCSGNDNLNYAPAPLF
jgi:hypothetical protein